MVDSQLPPSRSLMPPSSKEFAYQTSLEAVRIQKGTTSREGVQTNLKHWLRCMLVFEKERDRKGTSARTHLGWLGREASLGGRCRSCTKDRLCEERQRMISDYALHFNLTGRGETGLPEPAQAAALGAHAGRAAVGRAAAGEESKTPVPCHLPCEKGDFFSHPKRKGAEEAGEEEGNGTCWPMVRVGDLAGVHC